MNFIVSATTDIGLTKAQIRTVIMFVSLVPSRVKSFLLSCDGMGGLAKGEVASASLVNAFCKWADTKPLSCVRMK